MNKNKKKWVEMNGKSTKDYQDA